jgi:hypothetical protein
VRDPAFRAVPELVEAMDQLDAAKFPKLMAYLNGPASRRVRTNNHVERTNRMFRFLEKVRYKWRRRRTLVRFVVLKLDEVWSHWSPPKAAEFKPKDRTRDVRHDLMQTTITASRVRIKVEIGEECRFLSGRASGPVRRGAGPGKLATTTASGR